MDVLLSTGEQSGDILELQIAEALQVRSRRTLDIAAVGGRRTVAHGVRTLVDQTHLATLGVEPEKMRMWGQVLRYTIPLLKKTPPTVFIGITHHLFNYILAENLPECTYKIMVEPPEAWGWRASRLTQVIGRLSEWTHPPSVSRRHALFLVAFRDRVCLDKFDHVFCCTTLNKAHYEALQAEMPVSRARLEYIGRPEADLRRNVYERDALQVRQQLGVPSDHHILGIFPGSRERNIIELLPTMLDAAQMVLEKHRHVTAVISLADPRFANDVETIVNRSLQESPVRSRVVATYTNHVFPLLCASSHAILSSGTITLQAAVLGVQATVGYDLGFAAKTASRRCLAGVSRALLARHCPVREGSNVKMFFALPNAIVASNSRSERPEVYQEYCLKEFRAEEIGANVERHMFSAGGEKYSDTVHQEHLRLSDELIDRVRRGVMPCPADGDPMKRVADIAWAKLEGKRV